MKKVLTLVLLCNFFVGSTYGSALGEEPFPLKEGGKTHYTFEEFSGKMCPLLINEQLRDDFKEGFGSIFKNGDHRVSATVDTVAMNTLYRTLSSCSSEADQKKNLFDCFLAPKNSPIIEKYCVALSQRVLAFKNDTHF